MTYVIYCSYLCILTHCSSTEPPLSYRCILGITRDGAPRLISGSQARGKRRGGEAQNVRAEGRVMLNDISKQSASEESVMDLWLK